MLERQVLSEMMGVQLMLNKATDADKQKGREQFEKMLKRLKTDNKLTDEEFEQKLATQLRVQDITAGGVGKADPGQSHRRRHAGTRTQGQPHR